MLLAYVGLFDRRRVALPLLGKRLINVGEGYVSKDFQGFLEWLREAVPLTHFVSIRC